MNLSLANDQLFLIYLLNKFMAEKIRRNKGKQQTLIIKHSIKVVHPNIPSRQSIKAFHQNIPSRYCIKVLYPGIPPSIPSKHSIKLINSINRFIICLADSLVKFRSTNVDFHVQILGIHLRPIQKRRVVHLNRSAQLEVTTDRLHFVAEKLSPISLSPGIYLIASYHDNWTGNNDGICSITMSKENAFQLIVPCGGPFQGRMIASCHCVLPH